MKDTTVNVQAPKCTNWAPSWFAGSWRDWHRGHACNLDDGQQRRQEAIDEIALHESTAVCADCLHVIALHKRHASGAYRCSSFGCGCERADAGVQP